MLLARLAICSHVTRILTTPIVWFIPSGFRFPPPFAAVASATCAATAAFQWASMTRPRFWVTRK